MLAPSERPPDQFLHDLVGAAEDTGDARHAPCAGDRIFVHIARAAEQLQALLHHLTLPLGVPQLRRRALFWVQFLLQLPRQRTDAIRPAPLPFPLPIGQHEPDYLEIADALADQNRRTASS